MTNENTVRQAMNDLWYQNPTGYNTYGPCDNNCGRGSLARGSRACKYCCEDTLAALTGEGYAKEYHRLIRALREVEDIMVTVAEEKGNE